MYISIYVLLACLRRKVSAFKGEWTVTRLTSMKIHYERDDTQLLVVRRKEPCKKKMCSMELFRKGDGLKQMGCQMGFQSSSVNINQQSQLFERGSRRNIKSHFGAFNTL